MEQGRLIKGISNTVCVLGIALSTLNINSTMIIGLNYEPTNIQNTNYGTNSLNALTTSNNIYKNEAGTRLDREAISLFGDMREATPEEMESVNNYIDSISKDTGVNFFDIC